MEADTDLRAELAPLFVDEPPGPTVQDLVGAGRRRLRRRRWAAAATSLAVVVLVAGTYVATSGGLSGRADVVTSPDGSTDETTPPPSSADALRGFRVDHSTGVVTPLPGAELLDVLTVGDQSTTTGALAVDVMVRGSEAWWYVRWQSGSEGSAGGEPDPDATFTEWALDTHAEQPGADPDAVAAPQALVDVDHLGRHTLRPGVELVREIENPLDLAPPYTSSALEVRRGARTEVSVCFPGMRTLGEPGESLDDVLARQLEAPISSYLESGPMPGTLWHIGDDGMPRFSSGAEVLRTLEDPVDLEPPRRSVAWEVRQNGTSWWAVWELGPTGLQGAMTSRRAGDAYDSIEEWLARYEVQTQW